MAHWVFHIYLSTFLISCAHSECDRSISQNDKNIFLWSINHPHLSSQGYLFGTIHIPFTDIWNEVSDRVREAFYLSDTILLEINLQDEATIHEMVACKNLANGETVHSYLSPEIIEKIEKIMQYLRSSFLTWAQKQMPRDAKKIKHVEEVYNNITGGWTNKRPLWLLFLLYQLCEDIFEKSSSPFLDLYLALKAVEEKKTIISIETVEEQCNPACSVNNEEIIFAIKHIVQYIGDKCIQRELEEKKSKSRLKELIEHYMCGTLTEDMFNQNGMSIIEYKTEAFDKVKADEINKKLMQDIFVNRNLRMAKRIDNIFNSRQGSFIFSAIGAGHFLGNNSVLTHLEGNGFIIRKIKNTDVIQPMRTLFRQTAKFKRVWTKENVVRRKSIIIEEVEPSSSSTRCFFHFLLVIAIPSIFDVLS